jgi:hypothetical protein
MKKNLTPCFPELKKVRKSKKNGGGTQWLVLEKKCERSNMMAW